jgi:deoxyribonuclease-4
MEKNRSRPLLGAHMSIAGGMHLAAERAFSIGCSTMQVFVKNSSRWAGKPLEEEDVAEFRRLVEEYHIAPILAHDTYLINLCAADPAILEKSRTALKDEIERCHRLGIGFLNFHPGSHMGRGEEKGIRLIAESINRVHEQTHSCGVQSVLETTAGQGSAVGYRFEQLKAIIELVEDKNRMAVCIDTCHIFAAGYDISNSSGYEETFKEFDAVIGLERLAAFHFNDSKRELGSHIDRHEHIGKGKIGSAGFALLMNDPRFSNIPKILETPKGEDMKEDVENMKQLKKMIHP